MNLHKWSDIKKRFGIGEYGEVEPKVIYAAGLDGVDMFLVILMALGVVGAFFACIS